MTGTAGMPPPEAAVTLPTVADALAAGEALRGRVVRTPVLRTDALDLLVGGPAVAKAEGLQHTGSFKLRGALNRVRTLSRDALDAGLITVSAGNAALGAAYAAREYGARLTVVMPENAVPEKLSGARALGATVVSDGITNATVAFERAEALRAGHGYTFLHPFDDPMVVAGAATATIELLEDEPRLARLLVPCSGGGLIAGAILGAEAAGSRVEILGVQPEGADGIVRSLAAGLPVPPPVVATIADGLTAPKPGRLNLELIRSAGLRVVTVPDEMILAALGGLVRALRVVLEPAAAVGLAALLAEPSLAGPGTTGLMLSGSNVSMALLAQVLGELPGHRRRHPGPTWATSTPGRGTSGKRRTEGNVRGDGRCMAARREGPRDPRASRPGTQARRAKGRRPAFRWPVPVPPTRLCHDAAPPPAPRGERVARSSARTYVLDTSVLLADPAAIGRFAEHRVVLPVVVITELEAKRHHPELGLFARQALRYLDDLRVEHGRLDADLPVGDEGGTVRVELNHTDPSVLPTGFRLGDNDTRILSVARSLAAEGDSVVLVSKDLPLRVKAAAIGLTAQEYRAELPADSGWTGMRELEVGPAEIDALYADGRLDCEAARDLPCHTGLVLVSGQRGTSSALGRVQPDKSVRLVRGDREAFGLRGRSAEQRVALELLLDQDVGIVSLGGRAGTGKSALALCAGLEAVMERRQHRKLVVFRPLYAVGGQELGYLPGSEADKMSPWAQAVHDTLSAVTSPDVIEEVLRRDMLEVLPLTHIRGRSLHDSFVIVDEAQSLERGVLLTVLSRIGSGSRVVLTHDIAQRDNLRVGRHDGVVAVIEKLKGHPLFAHVTLVRSERSPIAALVTEMLEDATL